jgi:hypothetical protein
MLEAVLVPKGDIKGRCVVANSCKLIKDIHSFLPSRSLSWKCGLNDLGLNLW